MPDIPLGNFSKARESIDLDEKEKMELSMKIVYILLWSRETDHKCSMKRGILLCFGGEVQNLKKDLRIVGILPYTVRWCDF